ncbi:DUF6712 family protein [Dysgonomonas sp. 25]|uniref:DUF6712 family protein n=1 Tax=Dysgonomonas sp. 25 TaxID=2302933 RepID=UPI0013D0AE48|nr:DUF6712 family protein [Dysgonomonas sp. 25]NDV69202.1 hypothetical protein [Dysgonomonas sp. 25]
MNEYMQTPLISEELFKLHSPVTQSTDITDFVPYICIAQELYIETVLGQPLTAELKEQIASDTLTPANSDLIVRIAPALSFYAVYQALPFHWASIVNKGITIRESENSKSVDIKDIAQLRRWIKDDADTLRTQLIDFLGKCRANYPLWQPSEGCAKHAGEQGSDEKSYDSGFYFGK